MPHFPKIRYSTWSIRLNEKDLAAFQAEARRRGMAQTELFREWLKSLDDSTRDLKQMQVSQEWITYN